MFQHDHPKCQVIIMCCLDLENIHRPQNTIWEITVGIWENEREKITLYIFAKLLLCNYII
jgi:hypothetical protein